MGWFVAVVTPSLNPGELPMPGHSAIDPIPKLRFVEDVDAATVEARVRTSLPTGCAGKIAWRVTVAEVPPFVQGKSDRLFLQLRLRALLDELATGCV